MLCQFVTSKLEDLNHHLLEDHSDHDSAQVPSYLSINYLESHEIEDTSSIPATDPQQCKQCSFSSASPLAFKTHLITHLDAEQEDKQEDKSISKIVYRKVLDGAVLPLIKRDIVY